MDGCGVGDKMCLVDRINGEEEEEDSETVVLEKLNIDIIPNKI